MFQLSKQQTYLLNIFRTSRRGNIEELKFCMSKYLFILGFSTKFQLSVIFLSSVMVCWNCLSVCTKESIKINGCLSIKLSCCYYFVNEISCVITCNELSINSIVCYLKLFVVYFVYSEKECGIFLFHLVID